MLASLLRLIRSLCQRALERLDPVAKTPTIPPPAVRVWFQAELEEPFDLRSERRLTTAHRGATMSG